MAISGATAADALAGARHLGVGVKDMVSQLNVSGTTPTVTGTNPGDNEANVAWTNLVGEKWVDIGDGVLRGPYGSDTGDITVEDVDPGDYVATVYAMGAHKSSAQYTVADPNA
jgi:hypothetical protein